VPFGSFGHLPPGDSGKPVVRVSAKGAVLARTPVPTVDDNVVEIDTRVTARDGKRHGRTTIVAKGEFADIVRDFVAQAEAKGKDITLAALAQQRGLLGSFDLDAPRGPGAREPFQIPTRGAGQKPANRAEMMRVPLGFSPVLPHPDAFFGALAQKKRTYSSVCRAGRIVHTIHFALPDNVLSVKLPPPFRKTTPLYA